MSILNIAIITVGYNRPDSMKTLLESVLEAKYPECKIDLIISIDKGDRQAEIVDVANECMWPYGEKIIRAFGERQGLRSHIVQCGDLTEKYDAVVVLEDDLMVSQYFFSYVEQALSFYGSNDEVAGISLYKHYVHPGVNRPFEPVHNGFDAYLMQFAQSWGQVWTKKMWKGFREWYQKNEDSDLSAGNILPNYIAHWNKHSWLKYYMRYIVENNKYFVYPIVALSTNASDVGEHCVIPNNNYQVSLLQGPMNFRFPTIEEAVKYDVFFERRGIDCLPELKGKKLLDLYGNRNNFEEADYLISTQSLAYHVVDTIQLKYRPIELNCLKPVSGKGIYVYDLSKPDKKAKSSMNIVTRFDVRSIHWKKLLRLGCAEFVMAVKSRLVK